MAYTATTKAFIEGAVFIVIGLLFYLFAGGIGLSTIKGFLIWRRVLKVKKETKEQRLKRNRNVHLSLSLYLSVATALIASLFILYSKPTLTGFDVSAFVAMATIIPIAESIFIALIGNQLIRYGKRVLAIYQILVIGILTSLVSLLLIGFGAAHIYIALVTTASIFSMYYLSSVFLYYTKLLLKHGVAGI